MLCRTALLLLGIGGCAAIAADDAGPRSRAELTSYEETSSYADVSRFIVELGKKSELLRVEWFGKTHEGRALPLMILSDPPLFSPRELRGGSKPVILIMANIHAGEVEGKEAVLHLARRILTADLRPLLDRLVILLAPIYNADGNERIDPNNRSAQNGPIGGVGRRENAQGLDLNRDYVKIESPEARALVRVFTRWDPHVVLDLHTTNGSHHGYHLTYAPILNPNADERLIRFTRAGLLPEVEQLVRKRHKFRTYYYGNFAPVSAPAREELTFNVGAAGESKMWRTFDHRPRFGNNYVGLRNRIAVLSEAYSYLDFRSRVAATSAFVEEVLAYSARHSREILDLTHRVDLDTVLARSPALGVDFELRSSGKNVPILVGEVARRINPRSGREMLVMSEKVAPVMMPDFGVFGVTRAATLPVAYVFRNEKELGAITEKLQAHGLIVEELTEPVTVALERFMIDRVVQSQRSFQGHREVKLEGRMSSVTLSLPERSILVRTAQPLARLLFYLLEPESDDGLVTWNAFGSALEPGKPYPVYKLMRGQPLASRTLEER